MGNYIGRGQKQEQLEKHENIVAGAEISETKEFAGEVPRGNWALSRSSQVSRDTRLCKSVVRETSEPGNCIY